MKTKVQARAAIEAPECESESDDNNKHPHAVTRSDAGTSLASDETETTRSNIAELKEVTFIFPPLMWLKFQSESTAC